MRPILFFILLFAFVSNHVNSQKIIFLHHSTGGNVYNDGNVSDWFTSYNSNHSKNYQISELSYPNAPYTWDNYPYDFWNLWVNPSAPCSSTNPNIHCINNLTQNYNIIIFKHCFPGASVGEEEAVSSVSSAAKTIGNYQLQYRALRAMMDSYPNNKFIVWTLAPLHRNSTNTADAARAKQFVDWVKTQWLSEDGKSHPNIFIFDFWGIVAESNPSPVNGKVNCLKYEYEGDHFGGDSHPNTAANQVAGPAFGQFIVNSIENAPTTMKEMKQSLKVKAFPIPSKGVITFEAKEVPASLTYITIVKPNGNVVYSSKLEKSSATFDLSFLANGLYFYKIQIGNQCVVEKLIIQK